MPPLHHLPFETPLLRGVLRRRYNRFLADVVLDDGRAVVAHCVNTGRMEGLSGPGTEVWLTENFGNQKLRFTWQLARVGGVIIGANTAIPNRVVGALLRDRLLPGFKRWSELKAEKKYGENSRIDFWLRERNTEHFIEVKNCHLVYTDQRGYFPDSVSERASKHLEELIEIVHQGHRATVLFTVQRADAVAARPSDLHDPVFAETARRAAAEGVAFKALRIRPELDGYHSEKLIPVELQPYALDLHRDWKVANDKSSGWVQVRKSDKSAP